MKLLVTYDIRDRRRWQKVFKLLKSSGLNVQLSCFEVDLDKRRHKELCKKLLDLIDVKRDSVFMFPIGKKVEGLTVKLGKAEELNSSSIL